MHLSSVSVDKEHAINIAVRDSILQELTSRRLGFDSRCHRAGLDLGDQSTTSTLDEQISPELDAVRLPIDIEAEALARLSLEHSIPEMFKEGFCGDFTLTSSTESAGVGAASPPSSTSDPRELEDDDRYDDSGKKEPRHRLLGHCRQPEHRCRTSSKTQRYRTGSAHPRARSFSPS
jgi:hypothetical protein